MMKAQQATVIGSRMSEQDITSYLGFMPDNFNKEFTELFREVCVERGYFNKTVSKKIKFYRLPDSDYEKLTDGQEVLLQVLKNGHEWHPDVAFMFLDFKEAEATVNSKYPYGKMDELTRAQYVRDISEHIGFKLKKIDLLN